MSPRAAGWLALAAGEGAVAEEYVRRNTTFHLLLHGGLGLGVGFLLAAGWQLRHKRPVRLAPWLVSCQVWSQLPDLIYFPLHAAHRPWMDVFVAHVTIHLVPHPLPTMLAVFVAGGWAWWSARWGSRARAATWGLIAAAILGAELAAAPALPTHLAQLRPGVGALWCGPARHPGAEIGRDSQPVPAYFRGHTGEEVVR